LTKGLESESESWKEKEKINKATSLTVTGECMLCSGIIAYLGAFPIDTEMTHCPTGNFF